MLGHRNRLLYLTVGWWLLREWHMQVPWAPHSTPDEPLFNCTWPCRFDRAVVIRHEPAAFCSLQKMPLRWHPPLQKCQFEGRWKLKAEKCQSTGLLSAELLLIITQPNGSNSKHPWACYSPERRQDLLLKVQVSNTTASRLWQNVWLGQWPQLCFLLESCISGLTIPLSGLSKLPAMAVGLAVVLAPISLPLKRHHFPSLRYLSPKTKLQ